MATRFLSVHGASREQLSPARRLLFFAGCVTLALNVAEPLIAGRYGKAAFDSVGSWLLIGWAHVGPALLQAMSDIGGEESARSAGRAPAQPGAVEPTTGLGVDGDTDLPEVTSVPRQRPAAGSPTREGSDYDEELMALARAEDARHWELHRRPISAEELRKRLHVGAARSRNLVSQVRDERAAAGAHGVEACSYTGPV